MISKQFEYITSCIKSNGSINDQELKAPLNFQYHYSAYILSALLQNKVSDLRLVLKYHLSLKPSIKRPSLEFNSFFYSLSLLLDKNNSLADFKKELLSQIEFRDEKELTKLNNNFRALQFVNKSIFNTLSNYDFNYEKERDTLLEMQYDDGFFPDSNMQYNIIKNQGVPHLVYHAKILMCLGIVGIIKNDNKLKKSFLKGLSVLLDISPKNYYSFYGRSNNSLFGYGCMYLIFCIAEVLTGNSSYSQKRSDLISFLSPFQNNDGRISINLNKDNKHRPGYDGYMYDIVYNTYFNCLKHLGDRILADYSSKERCSAKISANENGLKVYPNSGFVRYYNKNIHYCYNFKGHQNTKKHHNDPRVSALSICHFTIKNINQQPGTGDYPRLLNSNVEKRHLLIDIKSILFKKKHKKYLPILNGNTFFVVKDNSCFYINKCTSDIQVKNQLTLNFNLLSDTNKSISAIVIVKHDEEGFEQEIVLDSIVDKLFYSIISKSSDDLSIENNQVVRSKTSYLFSSTIEYKKRIKLNTSFNHATTSILGFKDLQSMKVCLISNK